MTDTSSSSSFSLRNPVHFLAFGFGTGLLPFAPGTFGTLVAIPLYMVLEPLPLLSYILLLLLGFIAGVWICGKTSKALGVHDHAGIVWDEIVGYLFGMILAPASWVWIIIGFILFRFFDIVKPWPIRTIDQRVGGGFGIMLDDVLAGLYTLLLMLLIQHSGVLV